MNTIRKLFLLLIVSGCFAISACDRLTLGPTVETRFVTVMPGKPVLILENVTVESELLGTGEVAEQDIGGWVAMPKEHFRVIVENAGLEPIE